MDFLCVSMAENGNYPITLSVSLPYRILRNVPSGLGDDTRSDRRIGGRTDRHDIRKICCRSSDVTFYQYQTNSSQDTK
jgi:hypothetical protein